MIEASRVIPSSSGKGEAIIRVASKKSGREKILFLKKWRNFTRFFRGPVKISISSVIELPRYFKSRLSPRTEPKAPIRASSKTLLVSPKIKNMAIPIGEVSAEVKNSPAIKADTKPTSKLTVTICKNQGWFKTYSPIKILTQNRSR